MSVLKLLKQMLLPPRCIACGKLFAPDWVEPPFFCEECAKAFALARIVQCGNCFCEYDRCLCLPHAAERTGCKRLIKLAPYSGDPRTLVVRRVVLGMKRHPKSRAFDAMAQALWSSAHEQFPPETRGEWVLVHLPRTKRRRRRLGFDQAERLAAALSEVSGIAHLAALSRRREGKAQKGLNTAQRRTNVKDAFSLVESVAGRRVLLVDDVVTTAAGLAEAARLLRRNGALEVAAIAVAYTEKKRKKN